MLFTPPWRDPKADPPEEYAEVIVTTETDRVTSSRYYKGKFATHVPVKAWMPMPPPAREARAVKRKIKEETP